MAADKNVILITRLDRDGSKKIAHGWKQDFQISRQTNSIRQYFCSKFISNLYFFFFILCKYGRRPAATAATAAATAAKALLFFAPERSVPATSIQLSPELFKNETQTFSCFQYLTISCTRECFVNTMKS